MLIQTSTPSLPHSQTAYLPDDEAEVLVNDRFKDPISLNVMFDPVVTKYGHTFERHELLRALAMSQTCPLTRRPLSSREPLYSNTLVKALIDEDPLAKEFSEVAKAIYLGTMAGRRSAEAAREAIGSPSALGLRTPMRQPVVRAGMRMGHEAASTRARGYSWDGPVSGSSMSRVDPRPARPASTYFWDLPLLASRPVAPTRVDPRPVRPASTYAWDRPPVSTPPTPPTAIAISHGARPQSMGSARARSLRSY